MVHFDITGIEPADDDAFTAGGRMLFRLFYAEVVRRVLLLKGIELAAGLDKDGKPLRAIAAATVQSRTADINPVTGRAPYSPMGRAIAEAPPLQSTGGMSRTRSLFRGRVTPAGATFYWDDDPHSGINWGDALARHAKGFFKRFADGRVRYVPPRDVIGLSPQSRAILQQYMNRWWAARRGLSAVFGAHEGLSVDVGSEQLPGKPPKRLRQVRTRAPRIIPVPKPTVLVHHTRRPPAARVPARAGDFVTGWRQVR